MRNAFITVALSLMVLCANAQTHDRFANWERYHKSNTELGVPVKGEKRVVLLGNSITDAWPKKSPAFFSEHPYIIGRGISGQTSYQFLMRFYADVVALQPKVVVINYGTNDIAMNTGPYDEGCTFNNVRAMVKIAQAEKIKVILTSCLPAEAFGWRPQVTDAMQKVRSLNARVKAWAEKEKIPFVDYFSAMVSEDGKRLKPELASDNPGVHPNANGYKIMESLLLPVIEKVRK